MNLDLQFYWALFLKRLPVMLALVLTCSGVATVSALKLPPTYSTSAQLLVEEPQIPESMAGSLVQVDAGQQLQIIEQRILSRANLLEIARKHQVFEDIASMTPDAIVAGMYSQTGIQRSGGRGQATLMRVSFEARHGYIAANVVNDYVSLILEESTDFRVSRAEGALSFFEQEVRRLNDDLALQSSKIVDFKNENSNALPGDLNYRQNRQTLLQERQSRLEREIAALTKQRQDMVAIFETTGRVDTPETAAQTPEEQRLKQLRFDLQQALVVYSDSHPRIALLRNQIAQMEQSVREQASANLQSQEGQEPPASVFELTLAEMDQRKAALQEELDNLIVSLDELNASIQATAGNAIVLDGLERDFRNIQARYNEAITSLNRARVTERIELNAQGQRVSVLENANVPQEPSGPNRFKMIAMGVMTGFGLAGGFFVLLELLNRNIRRPTEMQSRFGIIPLAVIPYMESRRERLIRRSALVGAIGAVLVGVPVAIWYIDTQYMPIEILASKVFDRLGLT